MVEESVPERDVGDPEALRPEEEARITPPLETSGAPTFVQTLNDSKPYYERLRKKETFPSVVAPLSCKGHPFFVDTPVLPEVMKSFYNEPLATEGNFRIAQWPGQRSAQSSSMVSLTPFASLRSI